ncbi:MAG: NAD-dependent epimerase/dehydratase family protein, partial [Kiritimatiellaeota bacterium]|nr:NAD-dependent epimerase/dehydratase family protein [Kiritimatiellota bacterium]
MNTLNKMVRDDCARVLDGQAKRLDALQGGVLLITGGTGFMGIWLAELVAYLNDYHQFDIRLRLLSDRASLFHERAPHLATRHDIQLIEQDVLNLVELSEDVNWIIHAAGDPDNRNHATDPLRTLRVIVHGTDMLL